MKKSLLTLLGAGLLLTSCQSDEPFAPVEGGEKQVTFTLNVPGELGTRAASGESGAQNNQNANIYYTLVLDANGDKRVLQETTTEKTVTFTTPVVLGRKYDITAYASYTNNIDANASNIKAIPVEKSFNDETKDAYTAHVEDHDFALNALPAMQLKRPFGKLRLIATDYVDEGTAKNTKIDQVTVTYNNTTVTTYDATTAFFNNVGTGISDTKEFNQYYTDNNDGMPIFADYLPANGEGQDNPITFTVTVRYAESTETYSRTFNDIPVRRNALTTLKGNFFTAGAEITVEVKDLFDNEPINKSFVSTASQLQDAINKAPQGQTTEIILDGNIDLTQPIVFGVPPVNPAPAPTRSEEATAGNFILDLNGKTIENPNGYVIENYSAELTITGNGSLGGKGLGGIRSHGGKLIIEGGNYTCSSNWSTGTYQHILKAVNTEVTINGGTFDAATVGGTNNAMINVSENSVVTINAGTFKNVNVNEVIPQFAPYMFTYEKNGKLIINGGDFYGGWRFNGETATTDIYGGNFTVSYDGQSFHANSTHVLTIYGGAFSLENGGKLNPTNHVAEGYRAVEENGLYNVGPIPAAKVGNTEYDDIDEAIANWTNNTTLTLLKDVTLNDVVTLKSTEHHILNLGTCTMTAASGKNAIEILPYGEGAGTAAKSCLTINADDSNTGRINAGNKACIYYKKTNGINDRIMVTINGGTFDGTISSSSNNGGQACPYFVFNGGVFNKSINLTKAMLKVTGGIFHGMFSCTGDSTAHRLISGGTFKSFTFMTADAANKFTIGKDKQVYNVGLYVDKDGYLVVGGDVITEAGDKFEAEPKSYSTWSSYLKYSSAATYGLYYEK